MRSLVDITAALLQAFGGVLEHDPPTLSST